MLWTESKLDTVLKMAVCLAMIVSLLGCSGSNRPSLDVTTMPSASAHLGS
jgi:hypothetical protein